MVYRGAPVIMIRILGRAKVNHSRYIFRYDRERLMVLTIVQFIEIQSKLLYRQLLILYLIGFTKMRIWIE